MLKRFHRWIDRAWVDQGLCAASVRYPPWRLEILPVGLIALMLPLDWFSIGFTVKALIALTLGLSAAGMHCYFGWRLMYLTSMTDISQKLARGEEPHPAEIAKFTE